MTAIATQPITLAEFLELPETKPASEYIDGGIFQKPVPKGKHSCLQLKLCNQINDVTENPKIAYAFPELHCSFGQRSVVPDIAIFSWSRIPFDEEEEVPNDFLLCPDWTIEILSPKQSSNRLTGNILYCLQHGCQLGWLLDPDNRSILTFLPDRSPILLQGNNSLPVLSGINLELTAAQIFDWLKMGG